MPAKNPRLTITLEPALSAQIQRMSELTGNSQSKIIGELLQGTSPVFERLIRVLEAAKSAKAAIKGKAAADVEAAQTRMEETLGIVMDDFDNLTGSLLDDVEAVERRARKTTQPASGQAQRRTLAGAAAGPRLRGGSGASDSVTTPLSNRGVRYDQTATKTIAKKTRQSSIKSQKPTPKPTGVH